MHIYNHVSINYSKQALYQLLNVLFCGQSKRTSEICVFSQKDIYFRSLINNKLSYVVLYGCLLILKEERKLGVFENRVLRRIFETVGDENGEWGRLHNEELCSLYRSPNIGIRMIKYRRLRWAFKQPECRSAFKILTYTPTENTLYREA